MSFDLTAFRQQYPFRSHYYQRQGLTLHYLDEGQGNPVVMLHGNPTWSFYYRHLVQALSPRHRVIVPDHMGCGLSDKPALSRYDYRLQSRVDDLDALLTHLGLTTNLTLVLHDWGGMIGLAHAVAHPRRIRRLVILNTAGFFPPRGKGLPRRLKIVRNLVSLATPAVLGLNLFARAALYMAPYRKLSRNAKAGLIAPYNTWRHRTATLKFVQDIPLAPTDPGYGIVKQVSDQLHTLAHLPILICWGMHDFVFDADYLAEWRRRLPGAMVHTFPDAGHYLLEDKPATINRLVKEFLKQYPLPADVP